MRRVAMLVSILVLVLQVLPSVVMCVQKIYYYYSRKATKKVRGKIGSKGTRVLVDAYR